MRVLAIVCLLASTAVVAASWPGVPYTEVRGYAYNPKGMFPRKDGSGREMMYEQLVHDGKLAKGVVNKSGVRLDASQIQGLIAAVTKKPPETIMQARCFDPHHGFVFYDSQKHPVAWVEVCFRCLRVYTEPRAPRHTYPDLPALSHLCDELKLPRTP